MILKKKKNRKNTRLKNRKKIKIKLNNRKKSKDKAKKNFVKFKNKLTVLCVVMIFFLVTILLVVEIAQFSVQIKNLSKKFIFNQSRPLYIVNSQPIDIDTYLKEYFANKLPQKVMNVTVSSYTSTISQTDGNPYMTAFGTPVRDGIVAANFLPVGTVVRFPDKFGDKIFVVEDRMNERFSMQVDIWMSDQEEAKKFGIQYLKMEIF